MLIDISLLKDVLLIIGYFASVGLFYLVYKNGYEVAGKKIVKFIVNIRKWIDEECF